MRKTFPGMIPFWDYIGMTEQKLENGLAEVSIDINPNLLQRTGAAHGGVVATLIDGAVGAAIRSLLKEGQSSTTVELKVNYLRPAKGEYLIAKAKLPFYGGTLAVGQVEVVDPTGNLVAIGMATYRIMEKKQV